jgi:hypothetical protein
VPWPRAGFAKMGKIIMSHPSPLSAPCAAGEVAIAAEAGSRAESCVIVNGSDLQKASVAGMSARSWPSSGLCLARASQGPDDFK